MLEKSAPIVIFAGPPAPMAGFLRTDPGLASRIPYTFSFPDFAPPALAQIFRAVVKQMGFDLSADVTDEGLSSVFEKCGVEVRALTNGRLCQLAFKFAKEALDVDCAKQGTISWELNLEHVASGVSKAEEMQVQVLGKFKDIGSIHQKCAAYRLNVDCDTAPSVPTETSNIHNTDLPNETDSSWDNGDIQVKDFTTETKQWMQGKQTFYMSSQHHHQNHSESDLVARIRSLEAKTENASGQILEILNVKLDKREN
jgi:hypothetical protein